MTPTLTEALRLGVVPLDGGLGTRLAERGNDVTGELWSAEILSADPAEVRAAHLDYFAAGARVATTCSYQVSYDGFARAGVPAERVDELLSLSVATARAASETPELTGAETWILASVGPFGAARADGSEYTGRYGADVDEGRLREWHRRRLRVLDAAAPDALLCETIPSLAEARALAAEIVELDTPAILSVSVVDGRLRSGEAIAAAARVADETPGIIAVGVNCCSAEDAAQALREMRRETELPLVVYPNSGEVWSAASRSWSGSTLALADRVSEWAALGARLIGGCCRVDTREIRDIAVAVDRWNRAAATPQPR